MEIVSPRPDMFRIDLTRDELRIIRACVNEALELSEGDFHARVGADKAEVEALRLLMRKAYVGK